MRCSSMIWTVLPLHGPVTVRDDEQTSRCGGKDVDEQTCDLTAGVPVSTRVDGGTSGMLNIHVGP